MNIIIDAHTHTISSGHAYSTLKENVEQAKKVGLKGIVLSDHAPKIDGGASHLHFLNSRCLPRIDNDVIIYKSAELNILNSSGEVDLKEDILSYLDFALASLHLDTILVRGEVKLTNAITNAMQNKHVKVICHLCDPRLPFDLETVVQAAKDTNTALEVNNVSLNPKMKRFDKSKKIIKLLQRCEDLGVPITFGTDSHYYNSIGNFENCINIFKESGVSPNIILNTDIEKFNKFFGVSM